MGIYHLGIGHGLERLYGRLCRNYGEKVMNVRPLSFLAQHAQVFFTLCFSLSFLIAADAPHAGTPALIPIKETLAAVKLDRLAATPVQHNGRYKPLYSLSMEIIDGVSDSTSFGNGHTPLTSLLDLLFCQSDYEQIPVAKVKHTELRHDLSLVVPEAERALLIKEGKITPRRLNDQAVRDKLEELGRLTAKTKAINQVLRARGSADPGYIVSQLRLFPVPAGPHNDQWRASAELGGSFTTSFVSFIAAARTAGNDGDISAFAEQAYSLLPVSSQTAIKIGITNREDMVAINQDIMWPLWRFATSGKIDDAMAKRIGDDPKALATMEMPEVAMLADALDHLKTRWPRLQVPDEDLADLGMRLALDQTIERAVSAWAQLGQSWKAARHGKISGGELQTQIDAFVAVTTEMRSLLDRDHGVRGIAPLIISNDLELTYWRFNGFINWVWMSLLLAVPFLAMGGIGRINWALWIGYGLASIGFIGQLAAFIIRAQLAQRIPLANLYESMAAAALLCSFAALVGEAVLNRSRRAAHAALASGVPAGENEPRGIAHARGSLALAASLFGCLIVFAQILLEYHDINAFISPVMPILSEFWLRVHTACIVSSYGLIALGGLMSLTYLIMRIFLPWNDMRCEAWDRTAFAIDALAMLVLWVGLVLGAVWAAVSWGRPWGWDPKEVFALLTWVVYIGLVHLRVALPPRKRGLATAIAAIAAFVVMAFNWYWVNVQLAGLHSYA
jgi:ABC-type transport system involved in cytochrome c biogenesis permease subunit